MANKTLSLVIMLAALASTCACHPTESSHPTESQDNGLAEGQQETTMPIVDAKAYESCINTTAYYLAEAKQYITDDVKARVQDSIKYYGSKEIHNDYLIPRYPEGCVQIDDKVYNIWDVECFLDVDIPRVVSTKQNVIDMIKANNDVKDVLEAYFSCHGGRASFILLESEGILDVFKPASVGMPG